ncbi:MAG: septum formation family protein [Acidimicrobiia bacterium]
MRHHTITAGLLTLAISVTGCTSISDSITSTVAPPAVTTSLPPDETPTNPDDGTTTDPIAPPEVGDPDVVAFDAIILLRGYEQVFEPTGIDAGLLDLIEAWLPLELTDGIAVTSFTDTDGERIAVVSIIPLSGLRGFPFLAGLFALWADEDTPDPESATAIVEVEAASGGVFYLWSEGDGLLITTATSDTAAREYLEARAELDAPNQVWETGHCIYLPQDQLDVYGNAPWAPFPQDIVVPCNGPHNGEVLHSEYLGTDLQAYDIDQITYQRSYACDRAYTETFGGAQADLRVSLVGYMPDADEWERGDRYIACLAIIPGPNDTERLVTGPFSGLTDLAWSIQPGACATDPRVVVRCDAAHGYQYLGSVEFAGDGYPVGDDTQFDEACADLGEALVPSGDPSVEVLATGFGMGPFQFELGNRTVTCWAIAVSGDTHLDVTGSFLDAWSVVSDDADRT